ncbi:hypothetical protein ZEAMMB73_Zm00001d034547, partial [Zea mays]
RGKRNRKRGRAWQWSSRGECCCRCCWSSPSRPRPRRRLLPRSPSPLRPQQPDQERRLRDRSPGAQELDGRRAAAPQAEGRDVAAARLDHRVAQGGAVHRRGSLLCPRGAVCGGAGGRAGERHRAGHPHRSQPRLQPVVRRRRRPERLPRLHAGGGVRGQRHAEGAVRFRRERRVQDGGVQVRGRRRPHPPHLLQLLLPHQGHRRRLALRPRAGPGQGCACQGVVK